MDFKKMKEKKTFFVYSVRVCDELVKQFSSKYLTDIIYFDSKKQEDKKVKAFVFKNEPEIFEVFEKLVSRPEYKLK